MIPGLNWLRAMRVRRALARDKSAPDPGDMGTAFGLDASMEAPANAAHTASLEIPARLPWSQRLVRRPQR
jgi:hypothetical protein